MFGKFRSFFIVISVCAFCSLALAQADQTEARRQAALDGLRQLQDSLSDIENNCLKVRAQMQLADLMWKHDQERAKELFEGAFNSAFKPATGSLACPAESRVANGMEILNHIAQRDSDWAKQLVESLPDKTESGNQEANLKNRLRQSLAFRKQTTNAEVNDSSADGKEDFENVRSIHALLTGERLATVPAHQNVMTAASLTPMDSAALQINSRLDAVQALFSGDLGRAAQLGEMIGNTQFAALVRFEELNVADFAGNPEEALTQIQALPSLSGRVQAFINLAKSARDKKGAVKEMEVLLIAQQSIQAEKEGLEKAEALSSLAEAMIELDVERGFELAQTAILALNASEETNRQLDPENLRLAEALAKLSRFDFLRAWDLALIINIRAAAWFTKLQLCREGLL
ncbi:MAG: hypothetical protein ACKVZH_15115 [Blastocatellia bacterium]